MTSSSNGRRPASRTTHTSRNRGVKRSGRVHKTPEHKPLQKRDTGYRVGRGKTSSRRDGLAGMIKDPRMIFIGIVSLVVIGVLIFGVSSCVKGCTSSNRAKREKAEEKEAVNAIDPRVSADASEEVTTKLGGVLDMSEAYETIAKNADKIDETLIDLAIAEPAAVSFVANSIDAERTAQAYEESASRGTFPLLYTWDTRWGYASYADGYAAVSASGPVCLSIASMGLKGSNTNDPATVMNAVTAANLANGTTGMEDLFVTEHAGEIGLFAEALDVSADSITNAYYGETPVLLVRVKASSALGSANAHWALVTKQNDDGSYTVIDPTSTVASSHTWAGGAIAGAADAFYLVSAADTTSSTDDTESTELDDTETYEYDAEGNPI